MTDEDVYVAITSAEARIAADKTLKQPASEEPLRVGQATVGHGTAVVHLALDKPAAFTPNEAERLGRLLLAQARHARDAYGPSCDRCGECIPVDDGLCRPCVEALTADATA